MGVSGGAAVREHLWRLQESDKEALAFLFAMFMPFGGSCALRSSTRVVYTVF